jgi:uncharacterized protein with FMN-binding domain
MIPLFITSFSLIKKRFSIQKWYQLHTLSYIAYVLLFMHLIIIGESDHQLLYIVLFVSYSTMKYINYISLTRGFKRLILTSMLIFSSIFAFKQFNLIVEANTQDSGSIIVSEVVEEDTTTTLYGTGTGYRGMTVSVKVSIVDGVITDIDVLSCGCTSSHGGISFSSAAQTVANRIISAQSTDVDTVSGATYTTSGVIEAVEDALDQ